MTEVKFDKLLRQTFWMKRREELAAAWASDEPAPAKSEKYLAWEENFLADPWAAAGPRERGVRKRRIPRPVGRIALVAALLAAVTVGAAFALAPGLMEQFHTRVEPVVSQEPEEAADHYLMTFDLDTFSIDRALWADQELPEFGHWYPTWLPNVRGQQVVLTSEQWDSQQMCCSLDYDTVLEDGSILADGHIYPSLRIFYEPWDDPDQTYQIGIVPQGELRWKEVKISKNTGFLFWDRSHPEARDLIWIDRNARMLFHLSYVSDSLDNHDLLKIAKSIARS
jgi:hypothetical protein